mgnify:FL=1
MDPVLLLSALLLLAFGLIGVGTAEPGLLQDHLLRVGAALLALVLGHLLPPRLLLRYALHALVGVLLLLVLVLLVGDGPGGVRRWFYLGPVALQPSELAKLALILYLSSFVGRRGEDYPILGPVLAVGSLVGLVLVEPDFATAAFLAGLAVLLFVLAGIPWPRLLGMGLAVALVVLPFAGLCRAGFRYVSERFANFVDYLQGESEPGGGAYQVVQAKKALLLGGPFGQGPGATLPHLPEAHNDMVFASVVFATGWLGGAVVFLLYTLILLRSLAVGLALKGGERLLALGLGLYLALQAALNIGVTLGVLPVTGVPLPLVSYGGSSLLVSGFAVGLLSRLAREAAERPRRKGVAR